MRLHILQEQAVDSRTLADRPFDNAARRFAAAAEAHLLRLREPLRGKSDGAVPPTTSLQALLL